MAIGTVVWGAVSAISGGGSNLTPGYPSSPATGDLLVAFCYGRPNDSDLFTTPSGWSQLVHTATANGTYAVLYKESTGSETGTLTIATTGPANQTCLARMCKIPGAATSSIMDGSATAETEAAATPVSNAGVTTTVAGSLVVLLTGKTDGGAGTTDDYASWSGGSLTWAGVANGSESGFDAAIGIGTALKSATGATGTLSVDCTLTATGISYAFAILASAGSSYTNTQAETVTPSDSSAVTRVLKGQAQAESATATDAYASAVAGAGTVYNDAQTETATPSDVLAASRVLKGEAQAETATPSDALAATRVLKGEAQAETATPSDVLAATRVLKGEAQVESATATDAYDSAVSGAADSDSQVEAITATEAWGVSQQYAATLAEAVTAADVYASAITHPATAYSDAQVESATASDAYAVSVMSPNTHRFFVWNGSAWV